MTNPDMVVAMRASAGIVTDVGGVICHAAIVSRELGLPCVVGTETATTTLVSGQEVTVDGSAGSVYDGIIDLDVVEHGPPAELGRRVEPVPTRRRGSRWSPGSPPSKRPRPGSAPWCSQPTWTCAAPPTGCGTTSSACRTPTGSPLRRRMSTLSARPSTGPGWRRVRLVGDGLPTGLLDAAVATDRR